jgi:hypothetical protein
LTVSKRLKYEVLRRDNHACRYCGGKAPDVELTVDHVIPTALGGSDQPSNLVAACKDCNAGKSASNPDEPLVSDVDQRSVRWAQALKVATERRAAELRNERARTDAFAESWSSWTISGEPLPLPANWRGSITQFLASGLSDQFLADAVATAMGNTRVNTSDVWRYFCGVCWREIDHITNQALEIVDQAAATATAEPIPYVESAEWFIKHVLLAAGVPHNAVDAAVAGFGYSMWEMHTAYANGAGQLSESPAQNCYRVFKEASHRTLAEVETLCQLDWLATRGS